MKQRSRPIPYATWKHLWHDPAKQLAARIAHYLDHYGEMTERDLGQRMKVGGKKVPGPQIAEALKLLVRLNAIRIERINVSRHFDHKVGRPSWRLVLVSVPPSLYSDQQALALRPTKPRRKRHKQSQWFKDNVLSPSGRFYAGEKYSESIRIADAAKKGLERLDRYVGRDRQTRA
jgi:hypothetical protein